MADDARWTLIATGLDQLREQTPFREGHTAPSRLFSDDDVRVMHLALDEGAELKEHTAPSPILVQVLEGRIRFDIGDEGHDLGPGAMIHVAGSVPHAVTAVGASRILILLLDPRRHTHR
ncbi:cupin domain-containing protein [Nocardiopsis quinghaiensis]|uniref:cupin domain-containing protein n=1 Tax=Nocardiopsis quinghaiensis TaxID=464995 RepID=UPI0012386CB8|nr:cupin domain-containing protein [Nocardiopsis quinghaiensis]